jgi:hypothetical protein
MLLELIGWNFKYRYHYTMEGIMTLGRGGRPGLAGAAGKGYISYQLEGKHISVGAGMQAIKLFGFYRITTDLEGLQL